MNFEVLKIQNCFSGSESYEYQLPLTGREMLPYLTGWNIRINEKLRRPTVIAEKEQVILKSILDNRFFRVSFSQKNWEMHKLQFEEFLRNLP